MGVFTTKLSNASLRTIVKQSLHKTIDALIWTNNSINQRNKLWVFMGIRILDLTTF